MEVEFPMVQEALDLIVIRAADNCESADMGAGSQTWVLCRNDSCYSPPSHLSTL